MRDPTRWLDAEELTPGEREVLASGEEDVPPADAEGRIWAGLLPWLGPIPPGGGGGLPGGGGGGGVGGGPLDLGGSTAAGSGSIGAAAGSAVGAGTGTLGGTWTAILPAFAAGLAGGIAVNLAAYAVWPRFDPPAPVAVATSGSATAVATAPARPRLAHQVPAAPEENGLLPPPRAPAVRHPPARSEPPPPSSLATFPTEPVTSPAPPPAASSNESALARLREEARLLREAREALHQNRLSDAWSRLETARVRYPTGALGQEREALVVELLYRSGQRAAASERAQAFVTRFPGSPHAARLREFIER